MIMKLLNDKVIFLTGGSAGIGLECAKAYALAGAKVVVAALEDNELTAIRKELGDRHLSIACDVADSDAVSKAINQTLEKYGRIDAIHNNAGFGEPFKQIHETGDAEWNRLMNVNIKGIYHTTKFGFDALKISKGSILNTSSIVGEIGQEMHAAYAATKGAVNALTKSMALDYSKFQIRVNAVSPAAVWTPMLDKWINEQEHETRDTLLGYLKVMHPLGNCPNGDVIADACVFLLSDMARFITGCILPVSGGAELGYKR